MGRSRDLADGTLAELNVDSNTLAVDATNNRVGIGTASPSTNLHVSRGSAGGGSWNGYTALAVESPNYAVISLKSPNANFSQILFADLAGTSNGQIAYMNSAQTNANSMQFYTNNAERMRIDSSGVITIPNQPSIHLDGNSGSRYNAGGVNITQFSANHSYGGMSYNSSNGRVTVPIAGRYLVCWNFYTYFDNTGELRIQLQVNGTGRMHFHKETQSNQSAYGGLWDDNFSGSTVINLGPNDAIGFYVVTAGGGGGYYMGSQHSYWSAHLLG